MKIVKNDTAEDFVAPVVAYDPNKRYSWTPNDVFELSGEQFGLILNAFRSVLSTPEAGRILLIDKANEAVEKAMAVAVERGIVKEAPEAE
jgi:hypothetical protein